MKKILKCIVFLTIFIIILSILSKIFIPKDNTEEAGVEEERIKANGIFAEKENTIDVYVVGDSETYSAFSPLEIWNDYGITSYVSGTPGQALPLTFSYLYKTLKKQKPKIVMLEANTFYKRRKLSYPILQLALELFPIFQFHDRWKTLSVNDFKEDVKYKTPSEYKGYYYRDTKVPIKQREYMYETKERKKIYKSNVFYIQLIKKLCDSKNAELVFYNAPSIVNWTTEKHNGVEQLANEMNIKYIDLNLKQDEVTINWKEDTRDGGDHLNHYGAVKVTKFLGKFLHENYELPDHRNDPEYENWNESYNNYIKEVIEE